MSLCWVSFGYSIAFSQSSGIGAGYWGGLGNSFMIAVTKESIVGTIPENLFALFQMTFAIITSALIVGAYVERIKFSFVLAFSALWLLLCYAPVTHWIWGGGFLSQKFATADFAGGIVVHQTAGIAALILAKMLGVRQGFPTRLSPPSSPLFVAIGAAMLWVGWFGFNAGSALAADESAAQAALVTHISAAAATCSWLLYDVLVRKGRATMIGAATGMVAGLACITPAAGVAGPAGALLLGLSAGVICNWMCNVVKDWWKIDDSLDVFAVHGVGGIWGTVLIPLVGSAAFGGSNETATFVGQIASLLIVGLFTAIVTFVLAYVLRAFIGMRVSRDDEAQGLDYALHGEMESKE